jgi:hypothetical protein
MREKNLRRAADALYAAQADDKNSILASKIEDKDVAKLVKDQGRALVVLEKLILPYGQNSFDADEMYDLLIFKLMAKGHRIQDNETPDDEEYAEEKSRYMEERLLKVPALLGTTLEEVQQAEKKEDSEFTLAGDPVQIKSELDSRVEEIQNLLNSGTQDDFSIDDKPYIGETLFGDKLGEAVKVKPNYDKIFVGVAIGLVTLALLLRSQED